MENNTLNAWEDEEVLRVVNEGDSQRKDTLYMRNKLMNMLGDRLMDYWTNFKSFILGKCTKREFDETALKALQKSELIRLHNELILGIIYNATKKLYPPSRIPKQRNDPDLPNIPAALIPKKKHTENFNNFWERESTTKIIRCIAKDDYRRRIVKLSRVISRKKRERFIYKVMYDREDNLVIKNQVKKMINVMRTAPSLYHESRAFPCVQKIEQMLKTYSEFEGISQGKDIKSCAELIHIGAKYMLKNYVSKILLRVKDTEENDSGYLFKLLDLQNSFLKNSSPVTFSNEYMIKTIFNGKIDSINSLLQKNKTNNFVSDDSINFKDQPLQEWYTILQKKQDLLSKPFEWKGLLSEFFPKHKEKSAIQDDLSLNTFYKTRSDILLTDETFSETESLPSESYEKLFVFQKPATYEIDKTSNTSFEKYIPIRCPINNLVNPSTPFSLDKCPPDYIPLLPFDYEMNRNSKQSSFDLKKTGINSLYSIDAFNRSLFESDPILIQKHINTNTNLGFDKETPSKISLADMHFQSYLDLYLLSSPERSNMRIMEKIFNDPEISIENEEIDST